MKKRLVALIMVMALALSLVPVGATEDSEANGGNGNSDTQIVYKGGTVFYNKEGKPVNASKLGDNGSVVEMAKNVEKTDKENEFLVTLNVKTNQNLTELSSENPDAAVVLVLDVSGSMDDCVTCGKGQYNDNHGWGYGNHSYKSRLAAAQEAACSFLEDFSKLSAGDGDPAHRWVKIIEFASNANTVQDRSNKNQGWIDVSTTDGLKKAKELVEDLDASGGTNIEAGLQLARNNLYQRNYQYSPIYNVDYLYTILLTDGKPTYGTSNRDSWSTSSISYTGDGSDTHYSDVDDVTTFANNIKGITSTSKLYSICFGTDSDGDEVWEDKLLDDDSGAPHWGFDKNITVKGWLQSWSSGAYSGGASGDKLFENFESIMTQIALSTKAFIVKDEMGQYMTSAAIQPVENGDGDGTVHNDASVLDNTLTWRILFSEQDGTSTYEEKEDGTITGYLSYTLKYKVTLDNLQNPGTTLDEENVNSNATLTYAVQKEDGTWDGEVQQGTFAVPKVKSHYGNLTFTKKGSDGKTLDGVKFTLTTTENENWKMEAESRDGGTVSFTNIPSGHTYTLTETSTPPGYNPAEDITVTVTKGNVATSMDQDGNSLNEGVLINQAKTGTLTVTKTVNGLEGGDTLPANFKIEVKNSDTVVKTLTTSNADSVTTYTWTVNDLAPGTYTVTESNYDVEGYSVETTGNDTATVTAGQTATANLTNTYTKQVPGLEVTKTLDKVNGADYDSGMVKVGDVLTYTITVENTGNTTLTNIDVSDTLTIAGTTSALSLYGDEDCTGDAVTSITSMAPGTSQTLYAKYTVLATDAGKEITNSATAEVTDGPRDTPDDPPKVTVENPALSVIKEVDKGSVKVGDTINYTITVTNTGNVDLTDVKITDTFTGNGTLNTNTLPDGVQYENRVFTIANLPVDSDPVTINVSYTAVEADAVTGTIINSAESDLDNDKSDDQVTTTVTEADNPAISITKTASVNGVELTEGDTVDVGDTITYTLKVENTGNTSFDTVTVSDSMWGEGKVETATMTYGDLINQEINVSSGSWKIAAWNASNKSFESGDVWTCTYTYTVQDGDTTIENTATVSTTDGGPDGSDTITIPVTGYDLSIDKVLTSVNGEPYQEGSKVRPGDVLTYTINVTNNNEETVTSFTVSDNLWQENQVETITIGAATADVTGGSYLFQGTLYQGDTWTCTYDYTVPEDVASVSNTAVINLPGDNDPDDTVTVEVEPDAPGLKVEKSLSQVNGSDYTGGKVSVGDKLTYTIQVTNTGNTTLSGVTVEDSLWNDGDAIQVDGKLAYVADGGTYTIKDDIAPDDMVTITYTYTVLRSDAGDTLTNTATVTTPDGGTTGEDTTETPVKPVTPIRPPVDPDKPELNTEDHYAYIVGYPDGNVKPEGNITRAEVATIFFRLLTDESRNKFWSQTNNYTDVPADAWYNNAVSTLSNAGIIDGYEDGTFKPDGNITRAEFATIAVRFFEATYDGGDLFSDIAGHWAQDYINEAANAGIVDGYPDGTFRPQQYITRAEAMTMVNRTIDRHPDADHLLDDMTVWPDNPETAWYYEQVQEATNSHAYTMNTDDEQNPYEIWTELLPNRDWSELEKEWSDANDGAGSGEVV